MTIRPGVTNFVHVGLVVKDLDETVRFLALLGFDCGVPGTFGGEWIDRIIGLENVTVEVVMARAPDGTDVFEVVRFHSPSAGAQEPAAAANRPGLRHIAFKVDDVRGVVDRVREGGVMYRCHPWCRASTGTSSTLSKPVRAKDVIAVPAPQEPLSVGHPCGVAHGL